MYLYVDCNIENGNKLKRAKTVPSLESGPMRGGFNRYIVWDPQSQERACESLKDPISLAIYVLFLIYFFGHFQLHVFIVYLEK
jgi:hypothetical protein